MDYSQYETGIFDQVSAFNLSTGRQERSFQAHWHSYGEIILVGPGEANVYTSWLTGRKIALTGYGVL